MEIDLRQAQRSTKDAETITSAFVYEGFLRE
jgi:hypothetical protein